MIRERDKNKLYLTTRQKIDKPKPNKD